MNLLFKKFFVFLLTLFISLEVFLRLYKIESLSYFVNLKKIHNYNPRYLVGLRANSKEYISHFTGKWSGWFTINSYGMRNLEEPILGKKKVICLGDSLVMGYGVSDDETFCYLLNREFQKEYQFLNAGIDGIGTWGAYNRLTEILDKVDNIHTVLFFVSPNDYAMPEILRDQGFLPDDVVDEMRQKSLFKKWLDISQFIISEWFHSIFMFKIATKQLKIKWSFFKQELKDDINSFRSSSLSKYIYESFILKSKKSRRCIDRIEKKKIYLTLGKEYKMQEKILNFTKPKACPQEIPIAIQKECREKPKEISLLNDFTKGNLFNIIQLSKQKNFQLIVVIIPVQQEEIYCNIYNKYHPLREYALQAIDFFSKNKIPIIDLMEESDTMCKEYEYGIQDFFIPEDGHLTKFGNFWVYNILSQKLKKFLE